MEKEKIKKWFGIVLLMLLLLVPFIPHVKQYLSIPNQLNLYTNDLSTVYLPQNTKHVDLISVNNQDVIEVDGHSVTPLEIGQAELEYQYKGLPLKKVNVHVGEQYQVIPSGHSIGVNLDTLGVLVVGHHYIENKKTESSPGKQSGVEIGDSILEMNNIEIHSIEDISPIVTEAGENAESITIKYKRGQKTHKGSLTPSYDALTDSYKIGLYIRDSAAGIGTMTFYDPLTNKYGALGHVISDMDTKKPIEVESGTVVRSEITSIQKGNTGTPGEKRASFNKSDGVLGNIKKNTTFGVFGYLDMEPKGGPITEPIPIAFADEVEEGPAQIFTVIDGEKVEVFDIEIISTINQANPATKGMVIQVTDERLLAETGGIVQGMSGSPIIQNNKIIGAVTHVFVNDPTSGYGIHIQWMLDEAEIDYQTTFAIAS